MLDEANIGSRRIFAKSLVCEHNTTLCVAFPTLLYLLYLNVFWSNSLLLSEVIKSNPRLMGAN